MNGFLVVLGVNLVDRRMGLKIWWTEMEKKHRKLDRKSDSQSQRQRDTQTRPDTRPIPVADGWAGAEMRVFPLFDSIITDQPTDRPTNGRKSLL